MVNMTPIRVVLTLWALLVIAFLAGRVGRADLHIVDLNSLDLDYKNFKLINPNGREPLVYPEPPKEGLALDLGLGIIDSVGYVNASIEAITVDSQYRNVGLELFIGVHVTPRLDVGFYHHSSHVLDEQQPLMPVFQEVDALHIKLNLYRANTNSIF